MTVSRDKLFLAGSIALVLLPVLARAQARSRYRWSTGNLRGISTVGGDFRVTSYGLGGLDRSGRYGGGDILRSSITKQSSFTLHRGSAGSTGMTNTLGPLAPSISSPIGQTYDRLQLNLQAQAPGLTNVPRGSEEMATASLLSLQPYLAAMGHAAGLDTETEEPITSFVPDEPSMYQRSLKQGDQSFRREEFAQADEAFELALTVARYSPESHLSRAHSKFALGLYYAAAYHLRKALTYFPELPLSRIRVRGFYERSATFVGHLVALQKATQEPDADAGVWLVLAYFRHFDDADGEAVEALRKAHELCLEAKDKESQTAVEVFWNGMVAAGKASGSLGPTSQPTGKAGAAEGRTVPTVEEPTTRPAGNLDTS